MKMKQFPTTKRRPSHSAVEMAWSLAWGLPGSAVRMEATRRRGFLIVKAPSLHDRIVVIAKGWLSAEDANEEEQALPE